MNGILDSPLSEMIPRIHDLKTAKEAVEIVETVRLLVLESTLF